MSAARVALLLVLLGYLCGSIPSGLLLARRAGVDVRRRGSGNIGAANVARSAGIALGLATLLADALKGSGPVLLARLVTGRPAVAAATGIAAFAGHVFPLALRFKGGKGVATALGVLATLAPFALACAAAVFLLVFALFRYVSLASVVAAAVAPLAVALLGYPAPILATALVMTTIITLRHRDNFVRLRAGTEPRFTLHKEQAPL
jgi:acyl phosphate:glycerol-3-phosphate acyltransferase